VRDVVTGCGDRRVTCGGAACDGAGYNDCVSPPTARQWVVTLFTDTALCRRRTGG
jgi:hypothetical protein